MSITWTAVNNAASYNIYDTKGTTTPADPVVVLSSGAVDATNSAYFATYSKTSTSLSLTTSNSADTIYKFIVQAVDANGNLGACSTVTANSTVVDPSQ